TRKEAKLNGVSNFRSGERADNLRWRSKRNVSRHHRHYQPKINAADDPEGGRKGPIRLAAVKSSTLRIVHQFADASLDFWPWTILKPFRSKCGRPPSGAARKRAKRKAAAGWRLHLRTARAIFAFTGSSSGRWTSLRSAYCGDIASQITAA